MIRRLLREIADRAFVGKRPSVPRGTPVATNRWTTAPPPPPTPEPADDLEVETPIPGSLLLDIREPGELASGVAVGALLIPMDLVPHALDQLPKDRPITVYCAAGARSWGVAHWLREQGFPLAVSLSGGIHSVGPTEIPRGQPGRFVPMPAGMVDGAWAPEAKGEVIAEEGGELRCRVRDEQGFWVERRIVV